MDEDNLEVPVVLGTISLHSNLETKLQSLTSKKERFSCGYLLGSISGNEAAVYDLVGLDLKLFENVDWTQAVSPSIFAELSMITASVPVGIDFVGLYITQPENGNLEVAQHLIYILKKLEEIQVAPNFIVCLIKPSGMLWYASYGSDELMQVKSIVTCSVDDEISNRVMFRLQQELAVNWFETSGLDGLRITIDAAARGLTEGLKPAFMIEELGNCLLFFDDYGEFSYDGTCADIVESLKKLKEVKAWPKSCPGSTDGVVNVSGLMKFCRQGGSCPVEETADELDAEDSEEEKLTVPVLSFERRLAECVQIKLKVDVLLLVRLDVKADVLWHMFRSAVVKQLTCLQASLFAYNSKIWCVPVHFWQEGRSIPITVLLDSKDFSGNEILENSYSSYRQFLSQKFLLPDTQPMFKRCVSLFSSRGKEGYHIINPHIGLPLPNMPDGEVGLVTGKYAYHHYMQDNFDDANWGCAYRSLQTLCSWFWLQGYTEKRYPSHLEIQEALVLAGDKDKSILGSREWIGSFEVSLCLDHLFGITSKILYVNAGQDLPMKGRELVAHFKEHGTPIMIGGGVLAHTILGVSFNDQTCDIRYLVLDPHYTGKEDVKTIQSKGWCGWKTNAFWNQNAHYNLCLPQLPTMA